MLRWLLRFGLLLCVAALLPGCLSLDLVERVEADRARQEAEAPDQQAGGADPDATATEGVLTDLLVCVAGDPGCPPVRLTEPGALLCTARVRLGGADPAGDLAAELHYDGRPLIDGSVTAEELAELDGRRVQLAFGLGGLMLPDGTYRCTMQVSDDDTVAVDHTLDTGLVEDLWELRACELSETVELGPRVRVCPVDQADLPEGTHAVTCSAAAKPADRAVALELDATPDDRPAITVAESLGTPELGVVALHGTITAEVFGDGPSDPLTNGDYVCRFKLADDVAEEHTFRIG
jgi:hypothetical protein